MAPSTSFARSRGSAHVIVPLTIGAVALVAAALRTALAPPPPPPPPPPAPGDTVVIHGPRRYDAPIGSPSTIQNFVDTIPVVLNRYHRYVLRVKNGNPDGTQRVLRAVVGTDSVTGTMAQVTREIAVKPTTLITVAIRGQASAGHLTVELLEINGGNYTLFHEVFSRNNGNSDAVFTRTFTRQTNVGAPFFVWITNGNSNGTSRLANVTVRINSDTVIGLPPRPQLTTSTYVMLVQVSPVLGSNTLVVTLPKKQSGFIDLLITATDITPPALTIITPTPNTVTRLDSINIVGRMTDPNPSEVSINGIAPTMSADTFRLTYPLPQVDGPHLITFTAVDAAGNRVDSTRTVRVDRTPPTVSITAPPNGFITNQTTIGISYTGSDVSAISFYLNGQPANGCGGGTCSFTIIAPLVEGPNSFGLIAVDAAGNTSTTQMLLGTRDTQRPTLTVSAPADGATVSTPVVTVTGTVVDSTAVSVTVNGASTPVTNGAFSAEAALNVGQNTITVIATDAATNADTVVRSVTRSSGGLPPDPATVATAIDPTVATTVFASTAFLYEGANPIQTGVDSGTIHPLRAAVLRGRVLDRDGQALSGVRVQILDHPEFGQTLSRTDGRFDLAVNGGGQLTVTYTGNGVLEVQRNVDVPWQDFVPVDDVTMVAVDPQVTTIDFSAPVQVARGSTVTDVDGTRQATLLFKQGTVATVLQPDSSVDTLTSIHVRATEFTIGPKGLATMPAPLPPASAYTYAAEFSADEVAAGLDLQFSQPVPFYLENFLGFPVGMAMPMAYYDRARAAWIPSQNGRVVQLVAETGGLADLDITGDGVADDATSLGVDDAERQQLATLYTAGQAFWRIPVTHFTPWDANVPSRLPPGAGPPNPGPATGGGGGGGSGEDGDKDKDDACEQSGASVVECENQTLGENIAVTGTGFTLNYRSDRVPARAASRTLRIPLTGDTVPQGLAAVRLLVRVAGQVHEDSFPATPNQTTTFVWDGKDAYGRIVQGIQPISIILGYQYSSVYSEPSAGDTSFGEPGGAPLPQVETRVLNTLVRGQQTTFGTWDARGQGLGGWTLNAHHAYDPIGGVLYLGDGSKRSAQTMGQTIVTVAGNGVPAFAGDFGPAIRASLSQPVAVLGAPDGSYYITDQNNLRIRKVSPDGVIRTVAGNGQFGGGPDSGVAVEIPINLSVGLALGPDGALYIAEWNESKISRVGLDGIMTRFAGTGDFGYSGDGGPATEAMINAPVGLAFGPDGSLYFGDHQNHRVRRIGPDGIITTVAGNGQAGFSGDDSLAIFAKLNRPEGVGVSPQGILYIADFFNNRVRRVTPDGIITTVAGNGSNGFDGDGGLAIQATLGRPRSLTLDADGVLYVTSTPRIRVVTPTGIIRTIAGVNDFEASGDGGPPAAAGMDPRGISFGANGVLYVAGNNRIRAVKTTLPALSLGEMLIAAADGMKAYQFDPSGRHISTREARTGTILTSFAYDSAGLLSSITSRHGEVVSVERTPGGNPVAIVGPFGDRTELALTTDGYLANVRRPGGETFALKYREGGLLDSLIEPNGGVHRFSYDTAGRLATDEGPGNRVLTLARVDSGPVRRSILTTSSGRVTSYSTERLATGDLRRSVRTPDGLTTTTTFSPNGDRRSQMPDGREVTITRGGDPRFGAQAPSVGSMTITTPNGLTLNAVFTRTASLAVPEDPLSLQSENDTVHVNGNRFTSSFDRASGVREVTSPTGQVIRSQLDSLGRLLTATPPGLQEFQFTYDTLGRVRTITRGTRVTTYDYDARGRLSAATDAVGRTLTIEYDSAGRVTRRVLPDTGEVVLGYGADANVTSVTNPRGAVYHFAYDSAGLLDSAWLPTVAGSTPTSHYGYNADRQLARIVPPSGDTISLGRDSAGRVGSIATRDGVTTFAYDPLTGSMISALAPSGSQLTLGYDGGLPVLVQWGGPVSGRISAAYNNDFRTSRLVVNDVDTITYQYDPNGALARAGDFTISHGGPGGRSDTTRLGSVVTGESYFTTGERQAFTAKYAGSDVFAEIHTRDDAGRVLQTVESVAGSSVTRSYGYDAAGRLASVTVNGTPAVEYEYDRNGNRLRRTASTGTEPGTYDVQDKLLTYSGSTYEYSPNGELIRVVTGSDTTRYEYNAVGSLVVATLPNGRRVEYVLDAGNRRVGKRVNGLLVQGLLYEDQLRPIAELDGANNLVSRFVYGARSSVPDLVVKAGTTYRIISDNAGSVRLVIDAMTGAVAQRLDYDEFGRVTLNSNPGFQPFGFVGGLYDDDTKLTHFSAREYDAHVGRWTTRDPVGFSGGSNAYAYVANDPVNSRDPSGLCVDCKDNLLKKLDPEVDYRVKNANVRDVFVPELADKLSETFRQLNAMGIVPVITDGFRTYSDQLDLWQRLGKGQACNPASSGSTCWHMLGYGVDLRVYQTLELEGGISFWIYTQNGMLTIMEAVEQGLLWPHGNADPVHFELPGRKPSEAEERETARKLEEFFNKCLRGA